MAHVQITAPVDEGMVRIVVDGRDISRDVLVEGFAVEFPQDLGQPAKVHMIVAADALDVNLPEAVIESEREVSA